LRYEDRLPKPLQDACRTHYTPAGERIQPPHLDDLATPPVSCCAWPPRQSLAVCASGEGGLRREFRPTSPEVRSICSPQAWPRGSQAHPYNCLHDPHPGTIMPTWLLLFIVLVFVCSACWHNKTIVPESRLDHSGTAGPNQTSPELTGAPDPRTHPNPSYANSKATPAACHLS
jgi:hypothetical protein